MCTKPLRCTDYWKRLNVNSNLHLAICTWCSYIITLAYLLTKVAYLLKWEQNWGFHSDSLLKAEPEAGWVEQKLIRIQVFAHHLLQELCKQKEKTLIIKLCAIYSSSFFYRIILLEWVFVRYLWENTNPKPSCFRANNMKEKNLK